MVPKVETLFWLTREISGMCLAPVILPEGHFILEVSNLWPEVAKKA
jgi:hypothetical protein